MIIVSWKQEMMRSLTSCFVFFLSRRISSKTTHNCLSLVADMPDASHWTTENIQVEMKWNENNWRLARAIESLAEARSFISTSEKCENEKLMNATSRFDGVKTRKELAMITQNELKKANIIKGEEHEWRENGINRQVKDFVLWSETNLNSLRFRFLYMEQHEWQRM